MLSKYIKTKYPESFDNELPENLAYCGSKRLTDKLDGFDMDIGKMLLSPTRSYAPLLKLIFDKIGRNEIHGIVHCTGGGQTKILHFIDNLHVIKNNLFEIPPIFRLIMEESDTDPKEMYKVFNMGHRMEIYLEPKNASKVIDLSKSVGIDAKIIGEVIESEVKKLSIHSELGNFDY